MICFKDKDAWAAVLNSFQRPDGFFNNTGHDGKHPGGSLWHAAGICVQKSCHICIVRVDVRLWFLKYFLPRGMHAYSFHLLLL